MNCSCGKENDFTFSVLLDSILEMLMIGWYLWNLFNMIWFCLGLALLVSWTLSKVIVSFVQKLPLFGDLWCSQIRLEGTGSALSPVNWIESGSFFMISKNLFFLTWNPFSSITSRNKGTRKFPLVFTLLQLQTDQVITIWLQTGYTNP